MAEWPGRAGDLESDQYPALYLLRQSRVSIDLIRIPTVGLELAYNGGSCGQYQLNLKSLPQHQPLLDVSASPTVRIRISPIPRPFLLIANWSASQQLGFLAS